MNASAPASPRADPCFICLDSDARALLSCGGTHSACTARAHADCVQKWVAHSSACTCACGTGDWRAQVPRVLVSVIGDITYAKDIFPEHMISVIFTGMVLVLVGAFDDYSGKSIPISTIFMAVVFLFSKRASFRDRLRLQFGVDVVARNVQYVFLMHATLHFIQTRLLFLWPFQNFFVFLVAASLLSVERAFIVVAPHGDDARRIVVHVPYSWLDVLWWASACGFVGAHIVATPAHVLDGFLTWLVVLIAVRMQRPMWMLRDYLNRTQ